MCLLQTYIKLYYCGYTAVKIFALHSHFTLLMRTMWRGLGIICQKGASFKTKMTSSGDLTEVRRLDGWSLVVLDARFIWLQVQLVTVLLGWRLVHRQPMPSGCHKISPVILTFVLFNGALWGSRRKTSVLPLAPHFKTAVQFLLKTV